MDPSGMSPKENPTILPRSASGFGKAIAELLPSRGAAHHVRARAVCAGFLPAPLLQKQILEPAEELGLSAEQVVRRVMLLVPVDGFYSMGEEVAQTVTSLCALPAAALAGQSLVASSGRTMP